jgi:hypothetical protein
VKYFYENLSSKNNKPHLHNFKNKPAVIIYNNNKITKIEYWKHNKLHRDYAPAVITLSTNNTTTEEWYYGGKKLTDEEITKQKNLIERRIKIMKFIRRRNKKRLNS